MFGQDLSDANLFRRVRRGDTRSFSVLVHRHDATLRRLASRLLAEADQVDPMLQKAYTKVWRTAAMARLGSGRDAVANWLYRVVYNTCVDELRRQPPHAGPPPPTGPRVRLPNTSVERRVSALRALSPGERIPLVLVDSEGFDIRAAARILQRKPAEVAADLASARRHWRDLVIGPPDTAKPEASGDKPDGKAASAARQAESSPTSAEPEAEPEPAAPPDELEPSRQSNPATIRIGSGNGAKPPAPTKSARVAHAVEGAFDSERFTTLKRWFRPKSAEDRDLDALVANEPEEDEPAEPVADGPDEQPTEPEAASDQPDELRPADEPTEEPPPGDGQPGSNGDEQAAAGADTNADDEPDAADEDEPASAGKAQETASADQGAAS